MHRWSRRIFLLDLCTILQLLKMPTLMLHPQARGSPILKSLQIHWGSSVQVVQSMEISDLSVASAQHISPHVPDPGAFKHGELQTFARQQQHIHMAQHHFRRRPFRHNQTVHGIHSGLRRGGLQSGAVEVPQKKPLPACILVAPKRQPLRGQDLGADQL